MAATMKSSDSVKVFGLRVASIAETECDKSVTKSKNKILTKVKLFERVGLHEETVVRELGVQQCPHPVGAGFLLTFGEEGDSIDNNE
jgi:hypothetical protein